MSSEPECTAQPDQPLHSRGWVGNHPYSLCLCCQTKYVPVRDRELWRVLQSVVLPSALCITGIFSRRGSPLAVHLATHVPASSSGLRVEAGCLRRHGAYPMSGTNERIHSAAEARGHERHKLPVSRLLELLNTWTHKLDAEILVPSGRKQLCYDLGVAARVRYGHLLDSFTR